MFRRSKPAAPPGPQSSAPAHTGATAIGQRTQGKGHPTPSRREAEAAARARAKGTVSKKAGAKAARARRAQQQATMRQGLRSGDERLLPARDQGPVRRFVRDRVDSRLCIAELLLPLLVVIMVLTYSGRDALQSFGTGLWTATILLVLIDTFLLVFRLRRDMSSRFADTSTKGAVTYGVMRSIQLRFLRLPKPQVKLGQKLPERY